MSAGLLHAGLEEGDHRLYLAGVKLGGWMSAGAAAEVAFAGEDILGTIVGGEPEDLQDLGGAGVGMGKPSIEGVLAAGRGNGGPEGLE